MDVKNNLSKRSQFYTVTVGLYFKAAQTAVLDRTITKVMKNDKPDKKVSMYIFNSKPLFLIH